jgi:hypothetical protein
VELPLWEISTLCRYYDIILILDRQASLIECLHIALETIVKFIFAVELSNLLNVILISVEIMSDKHRSPSYGYELPNADWLL